VEGAGLTRHAIAQRHGQWPGEAKAALCILLRLAGQDEARAACDIEGNLDTFLGQAGIRVGPSAQSGGGRGQAKFTAGLRCWGFGLVALGAAIHPIVHQSRAQLSPKANSIWQYAEEGCA